MKILKKRFFIKINKLIHSSQAGVYFFKLNSCKKYQLLQPRRILTFIEFVVIVSAHVFCFFLEFKLLKLRHRKSNWWKRQLTLFLRFRKRNQINSTENIRSVIFWGRSCLTRHSCFNFKNVFSRYTDTRIFFNLPMDFIKTNRPKWIYNQKLCTNMVTFCHNCSRYWGISHQ